MAYALGLPRALARRGLIVELVLGWETRSAGTSNPGGAVSHWTAGPRTGDRPSLHVCTYGRPGLAGPLCNVFLTRAGVAVVVAAGRANHAGVGSWRGLVGNSSMFGTEAENSGSGEWTAAQRVAYPKVNAAYLDLIGARTADNICGHHEWAPTRKIDPRDWPMSAMRAQVAAILNSTIQSTQQEDHMDDATIKEIARQAGVEGATQTWNRFTVTDPDGKELKLAEALETILRGIRDLNPPDQPPA